MVTTIFTVCALRTNVVFFCALFTLIFAFGCGTGAFWNLALGNVHAGERLTVVCFVRHLPFQTISPNPHARARQMLTDYYHHRPLEHSPSPSR